MKQPDLEEEALRLGVRGKDIEIRRQTMADEVAQVTVTTPTGQTPHADARQGRSRRVEGGDAGE